MAVPQDVQQLYERLATQSQRRHDEQQRDIFLVLAADVALASGREDEAERLRQQLVELSPHTMLRPFISFAGALEAGDIREYVEDLRQQYPPEMAAQLLENEADNGLLPVNLFDSPAENEINYIFTESPAPADKGSQKITPQAAARQASDSASPKPPPSYIDPSVPPALPMVNKTQVKPPAAAVKQRRRSPYENADYGPRVPSDAKPPSDFDGAWIIYMLMGLVGLLSAGIIGYLFIRPFLSW